MPDTPSPKYSVGRSGYGWRVFRTVLRPVDEGVADCAEEKLAQLIADALNKELGNNAQQ